MKNNKKMIKIFAIIYIILGALDLIVVLFSGSLVYALTAVLSIAFGITLLNAYKDNSKYRPALTIGVVMLFKIVLDIVSLIYVGSGLFMIGLSVVELALIFFVISLLNVLRKETNSQVETEKQEDYKAENEQ